MIVKKNNLIIVKEDVKVSPHIHESYLETIMQLLQHEEKQIRIAFDSPITKYCNGFKAVEGLLDAVTAMQTFLLSLKQIADDKEIEDE